MKKQLLFTMAALMGVATTASAQYAVGDIVQTNTGSCRVTGANMLTNGDFSNGLEGWTNVSGSCNASLNDTLKVYDNDPEYGTYVQMAMAAGNAMGGSFEKTASLRTSAPLAPGNYLFTYRAKLQVGGVTSNARGSGRNDNYQDVYINQDGKNPWPTETATSAIKASVAEWIDMPVGEWITVNYYYHTDTAAYVNFEFFNLSQFDCFTDFGVYPAAECADVRVVDDAINTLNYFINDTENFPGAAGALSSGLSALNGLKSNPQQLGQMTPSTLQQMLTGIVGMNGALGQYLSQSTNSADVSSYFSPGGYFTFDNAATKSANKGAADEWSINGDRWGVSAPWSNFYTNHIFAEINARYGLGEGSEYISAQLPAGKYLYIVQGAAYKYYANGSGSTSNIYIPDYCNPRDGLGFFINADSTEMEDVPTAFAKTYIKVFDVAESGEQTVGFYRKGNEAFGGNDRNKYSGGGRVMFDNVAIRILGKSDADINQFFLENTLAASRHAVEVMRDSAVHVHADDVHYIFGKQTLQDSIDVTNAYLNQCTEATQENIDILDSRVSPIRDAIRAYYAINAEYTQLYEDITLATSLVDDPDRTEGKTALQAALDEANSYFTTLNTSSERDSARLVSTDVALMAAVQTFYNANASFDMPGSVVIQNADFADDGEHWVNDGLTGTATWKYGSIDTGADVSGEVRAMYYNRGNTASDIKWLYQDVPVTANGAYEFFATCAVHRSTWTDPEGNNSNTYLYANHDSIYVITEGPGVKDQVVGKWGKFSVVTNVTDFNDPEVCPEPGYVRVGLEKRSDIDGLQLNIIYFAEPKLLYYGDWDGYLDGIYTVETVNTSFDVYNLSGMKVRSNATSLEGLPKGIYIVNGKKQVVD